MKAAILHEFRQPLTIEEVDRPKPDAHEVLIEVQACGVCHSDLHVASGDWPQIVPITKKPLILGHEIAGRVVEKAQPSISWNLETVLVFPGYTGPVGNVSSAAREMKIAVRNNKSPV
jgi:threonine dehydrogenase-like Zn-dependent dehydrogenase